MMVTGKSKRNFKFTLDSARHEQPLPQSGTYTATIKGFYMQSGYEEIEDEFADVLSLYVELNNGEFHTLTVFNSESQGSQFTKLIELADAEVRGRFYIENILNIKVVVELENRGNYIKVVNFRNQI